MTVKSNKSFSKRLKVSKNGKIKARGVGHGHFNGKESGRKQLAKHRMADFNMSSQEKRRFLAHI